MIKTFSYSFLIVLLCGFAACKKQDSSVGLGVQPGDDLIGVSFNDTATLQLFTTLYDSARSYSDRYKYIGSNQDPYFGRTDASIYTNVSLPNSITNLNFGADAVLDSAEIILAFTQTFAGDTNVPQRYEIYAINDVISKDSLYYVKDVLKRASTPLASITTVPTMYNGYPCIRIPMDHNYAEYMLTNPQYSVDNTTFTNNYKGFYITCASTALNPGGAQGALLEVDLDHVQSGLFLYYHNGQPASPKMSKTYQFTFSGTDAARFNHIAHDYTAGATNSLLQQVSGDSLAGGYNIFPQGLCGTRVKLKIPYMKNFGDSCKITVNRAEIVLNVDQSFTSTGGVYTPPPTLAIVAIDSLGREAYVKDQYDQLDLIKYGGDYDETNQRYVFSIARHMQQIVDGKLKNYGFYLVVADPSYSYVVRRDDMAGRVVLGGTKNMSFKPAFRVTYIKFPHDK